jgi:hypothetical protein
MFVKGCVSTVMLCIVIVYNLTSESDYTAINNDKKTFLCSILKISKLK